MRALVTGGGRGIGKAIVAKFLERSIEVVAPGRQSLDLRDPVSIESFCSRFDGPLDVLVNNAGINEIALFGNLRDSQINDTLNVNLMGPIKLIRGLLQKLEESPCGRIVNISSVWSVVSKEGRSIYSISKSGLNALTRSLATELSDKSILVNCVAPGFVDTELTSKNNSQQQLGAIKEQIPLKRLAEPGEIAELVYFLSSSSNTYITGQTIIIDGGFTCI